MFEIKKKETGEIVLTGRFDASQAEAARELFASLTAGTTVDFQELDYISSMGLGVLLEAQKRLRASGAGGLRLVNVNRHILDIFRFSGFHQIFEIEPGPG